MTVPTSHVVGEKQPALLQTTEHDLCPGCGEPVALRILLETIAELGLATSTVAVVGIGCYTAFSGTIDLDLVQALHGRAPSVATGVKRMLPDRTVLTLQGDGDMVNEGLQEVVHAAARGENVTCMMLNNGVFGETGGHRTATTVICQRTKNSLEGRNAADHGHPILLANIIVQHEGAAYVARGAVNTAHNVALTKQMITSAYEAQIAGRGFSFVEILTMCPTGWFIDTAEAPEYLGDNLAAVHRIGVLKDVTRTG